jgi:hypothetical protein
MYMWWREMGGYATYEEYRGGSVRVERGWMGQFW